MFREDSHLYEKIIELIVLLTMCLAYPALIIGGLYVVVFDLLKFLTLGS